MKGLLEGRNSFKEEEEAPDDVLSMFDAGVAIKIESYEISPYNSLIELAMRRDMTKAIRLLNQNLKEKQQTKAKRSRAGSSRTIPAWKKNGEEVEEEHRARRTATSSRSHSRRAA